MVRSYARWFGVDLDPGYVAALRRTLDGRRRARRADRGDEEVAGESDEWFAYVAGYTSGGLCFGIT